jgi:hypothetical protein
VPALLGVHDNGEFDLAAGRNRTLRDQFGLDGVDAILR